MSEVTDDSEAVLLDIGQIMEMIKDDETYEALMTLYERGYTPTEVHQAFLYLDITESGERD